jgi:plasmid stabilization system protein ParE
VANVSFHPEARDDYDSALAWYQARSSRAATRFETEVDRVVGLIAANPDSFPLYDDEHRFAILRKYPYSVVYRVEGNQVLVVAVAHSSRDAGYWSGRR